MPEKIVDWNERYVKGDTPWDSGQPSVELQRVLAEYRIAPCRALELGCGTGTNAIHLAQQGFDVTAFDVSQLAIDQAEAKAKEAAVKVRFLLADITRPPGFGPPFPFVFDRGLYHVVRGDKLPALLALLERVTQPGSLWLTLAGNANEPMEEGPPAVSAAELCQELETLFALVQLREFRFDGVVIDGKPVRPLAWSALLRRR